MKSLFTLYSILLITILCFISSSNFSPVSALDLVEIASVEDYERFALGDEYHAALIFFYAGWDKLSLKGKKTFQDAVDQMTQEHITGLVCGLVDAGRHPQIARKVGIRGIPHLLLYQFGTIPRQFGAGYHESGFTPENIIQFATREAHLHRKKLDKIREAREEKEKTHYDFPHPNPGKIIDLTPSNFNRVIRDPTKTAFVMYYANWCEICKNTMPIVEQLAKYYESTERVVIGRMDVDENQEWLEANGLKIEGVPTFYLYPRGRKDKEKGWEYIGDRDFESMEVYLNGHNKKGEQDMEEFHRSIIANKPHDSHLPDYMKEHKFTQKDAMPAEIFGEDGRPHGEALGGVKNTRPMHKMEERPEGHKTQSQLDEEEKLSTMTEEEKQEYLLRKAKHGVRKGRPSQQGAGPLPPQMRGKLD
jgi:thiol-disulfide isomerase/thioredoxin